MSSDTDDTDSLLSVAAPTNLTNFLGLTVEEMSQRINSLTNNNNDSSNTPTTNNMVPSTNSSSTSRLTLEDSRRAEAVKNDLLNQLEEYSDSDNDIHNYDEQDGSDNEGSTASTNSITLSMFPEKDVTHESTYQSETVPDDNNHHHHHHHHYQQLQQTTTEKENDTQKTQQQQQQDTCNITFYDCSRDSNNSYSSNNNDDNNKSIQSSNKLRRPNYGVRVSPGFGSQGLNFLQPSPSSGWRYTPASQNDTQITTRAPNFRQGYKPPENAPPPRNLTNEELQEEVRKMYTFQNDDEDEEEDEVNSSDKKTKENTTKKVGFKVDNDSDNNDDDDDENSDSESDVNEEKENKDQQKTVGKSDSKKDEKVVTATRTSITTTHRGDGDNIYEKTANDDDDNIDSQILPVDTSLNIGQNQEDSDVIEVNANGKSTKRKFFTTGGTVNSIPDLGFGLRDFEKLEVKENPIKATQAWVTGNSSSNSGGSRNDHEQQELKSEHQEKGIRERQKEKGMGITREKNRNDKHYYTAAAAAVNSTAQIVRDENNLEISPIKQTYLEKSGNSPDISRCLPRRSKQSKQALVSSPRKVSLLELDLLWRDIQRTKSAMEEEMQKDSANLRAVAASFLPSLSESNSSKTDYEKKTSSHNTSKVSFQQQHPGGDTPSSSSEKALVHSSVSRTSLSSKLENLQLNDSNSESNKSNKNGNRRSKNVKKSILKSGKSKSKSSPSSSTPSKNALPNSSTNELELLTDLMNNQSSGNLDSTGDDLTSLLSLFDTSSSAPLPTELNTMDFSSILSAAELKPSDFDDILNKIGDEDDNAIDWEQINVADDEIANAVTKLELSDWAQSGAQEYVQKFYEEKQRRQLCESEITNLNKAVLKLKEELAVKSKMCSKKDACLLKMTKAWNDVTSRWKVHEKQSKEVLAKLQKEQTILLESSKKNKDRIDRYEKELANAVELATSFKSKLETLEQVNNLNVQKLEQENQTLKNQFTGLDNVLEAIKVEKDVAVRALSESQKQLDERNNIHQELEEQLTNLQIESEKGQKDYVKIIQQKEALQSYLQTVTVQKDTLEEQLEIEKSEKERLELMLKEEIEKQVKAEQKKHQQYIVKLQESLQQQSHQAIIKEAQMIKNHQDQLEELEAKVMKMVEDCRIGLQSEMKHKQRSYEKEIRKLRTELAQKQQFISTISQQFYEQTASGKGKLDLIKFEDFDCVSNGSSVQSNSVSRARDRNVSASHHHHHHHNNIIKYNGDDKETHLQVDEDGATSSSTTEDFNHYPSQVPRFHTSTPNSVTTTPVRKIKGWRELPNISHLITPKADDAFVLPSSVLLENETMSRKNKIHTTPLKPTPSPSIKTVTKSKSVAMMENYTTSDIPTKLNITSEQLTSEQGIRKCIQTLVKVYSNRLHGSDAYDNTIVEGDNSESKEKVTCQLNKQRESTCNVKTKNNNDNNGNICLYTEVTSNDTINACKIASAYKEQGLLQQGKMKPPWK